MRDVVMPGIGLYRTWAARSGQYAGMSEPEFGPVVDDPKRGRYPRVVPESPSAGWLGTRHEFTAKEYWIENYAAKKRGDDSPNAMWSKRPFGQLAKCTEARRCARPSPSWCPPRRGQRKSKARTSSERDITPASPRARPVFGRSICRELPEVEVADRVRQKTADDIINSINSKAVLTEDQVSAIRKLTIQERRINETHDSQPVPGTPEWEQHRASCFNASDAAAMPDMSPYKSRSELIREVATGVRPDVSPELQRRFDDGHRFEAAVRPLAERLIGEELFTPIMSVEIDGMRPVCAVRRPDDERRHRWEHKTLNKELDSHLSKGIVPVQYHPQLEQRLAVSGAGRVLFMASNGTEENRAACVVRIESAEIARPDHCRLEAVCEGRCRLRPRGVGAGPGRRADHGPAGRVGADRGHRRFCPTFPPSVSACSRSSPA